MNKTKTEDLEIEIGNELRQFYGSVDFTLDPFSKCLMTDGMSYLIEKAKCHWLFSDYAIEIMMTPKLKAEGFIVLTIKVDKEKKSAVVTLTDGNENKLHRKTYGYTDFPLTELNLYICDNDRGSKTFMLPSEY